MHLPTYYILSDLKTARAIKVSLIFCSSLSFSKAALPVALLELAELKVPKKLNSIVFRHKTLKIGWNCCMSEWHR